VTWAQLTRRSATAPPDTPITYLVRDTRTNDLLGRIASHLDAHREALSRGDPPPELVLSRQEIAYARDHWEEGVRHGERRLYDLAALLSHQLLKTRNLQRVARIVAGPKEELEEAAGRRIVIEEFITRDELLETTDHGLAMAIAGRYRHRAPGTDTYEKIYPRASFLELRPLDVAEGALASRVLTRVKANGQIWNKVCNALFDIDTFVKRDKILNVRSKYVKDVFGLKVLTSSREQSYLVEGAIERMTFDPAFLIERGLSDAPTRLSRIERKDYTDPRLRKATGWEAIKNVYRWGQHVFEIQIQTEANYHLEVSHLSTTSHRTFDMQRRELRRDLEKRLPLYGPYRRLLRAIFSHRPDRERYLEELPWVRVTP